MKKKSDFFERYSRQISMAEIGEQGQKKLSSARVLLVGVGGLGSVAGFYLVGAGIGTLGIIDDDMVELSNLQRQIAHSTADLGRSKVDSAAEKFSAFNPDVTIVTYEQQFSTRSAPQILDEYDFVIDATDNFPSKFVVADACHHTRKPYSHAGILRFHGQTITVLPGKTCCYRCIFNEPPPETVSKSGVVEGPLGVLPGVIGTIQATEAIKYFLGCGELLTDRLLTYDALAMNFRTVTVKRNQDCPLCGKSPSICEAEKRETNNIGRTR